MRMKNLFSHMLREPHSYADRISYQALLRAGFIQHLGSGTFVYLPLGLKTLKQLTINAKKELNTLDGTAIQLPLVQSPEIWPHKAGEGTWINDTKQREFILAHQYGKALGELVFTHVVSYRQLPVSFHHRGQCWQEYVHHTSGLFYSRVSEVFDLFQLHTCEDDLEKSIHELRWAINRFFQRCQVPAVMVESGLGDEPGRSKEWIFSSALGRTKFFICENCGYAANEEIARFTHSSSKPEEPLPVKKIPTPDCTTIEDLAKFLQIPKECTAKIIFLMATFERPKARTQRLIFAVIPGDRELNEKKLQKILGASTMRPAFEDEIRTTGAVPGYASPVGLKDVHVVVDVQITLSPNLICGANEEGYHLLNVNFGRDYTAQDIADISLPRPGDPCPVCGDRLRTENGIKLAQISQPNLGHTYMDKNGKPGPIQTFICRLDLSRTLACVAETHHDENGLTWPLDISPYPLHLILLGDKSGEPQKAADELYAQLQSEDLEPLFDDRPERAGVKFVDADLIGLPLRLTVSKRSLNQGGVEFKRRKAQEKEIIPLEDVIAHIKNSLTDR